MNYVVDALNVLCEDTRLSSVGTTVSLDVANPLFVVAHLLQLVDSVPNQITKLLASLERQLLLADCWWR